MTSERKFYRTRITLDVLSEKNVVGSMDLGDIAYFINEGEGVGNEVSTEIEEIDAATAANLLGEYGSDPGFFLLDEGGNDMDDV